jgi:hypothetical protein
MNIVPEKCAATYRGPLLMSHLFCAQSSLTSQVWQLLPLADVGFGYQCKPPKLFGDVHARASWLRPSLVQTRATHPQPGQSPLTGDIFESSLCGSPGPQPNRPRVFRVLAESVDQAPFQPGLPRLTVCRFPPDTEQPILATFREHHKKNSKSSATKNRFGS